MAIHFFTESISFKLTEVLKVKRWVKAVILQEKHTLGELNFVFCNDDYLHEINVAYLQHDDYTDIITFDNSEKQGIVEGDIFISVERVQENAQNLQISFEQELHRVMIHGVLHLLGYRDKTDTEVFQMRSKENEALALLQTT